MWTSFVISESVMVRAGWGRREDEWVGGLGLMVRNDLDGIELVDRGDWAGITG